MGTGRTRLKCRPDCQIHGHYDRPYDKWCRNCSNVAPGQFCAYITDTTCCVYCCNCGIDHSAQIETSLRAIRAEHDESAPACMDISVATDHTTGENPWITYTTASGISYYHYSDIAI